MSAIFSEINKIEPEELVRHGILKKARKRGWVCPACKNGTGKTGDGLNLIPNTSLLKCHKCDKCYTAFDLIAEHFGYDGATKDGKSKTINKAKELFKLTDDFISFSGKNKKVAEPMTAQATEPKKDYSKFYQLAQNQLAGFLEKTGGKFRGLNYDDLKAVGAGIATATDLKSIGENIPARAECLILPYDNHRFFMRQVNEVFEGFEPVKRGNTGGKKDKIYNPFNVDFEKAVFVPEGEIDCLSIHKAGFQSVGIGGAGEYKKLIEYLDDLKLADKSDVRIILMFDNNDAGAGQDNAQKALQALNKAGYPAINAILSPNEKYDANEFLQKDFNGLKERLTEICKQTDKELDKIAVQIDEEQNGLKLKKYFKFNFRQEVNAAAKFAERKTGFKNLDSAQVFLPGLYVVGGLSALGKSTFAWQMLSQLAERDETCIYCSYEMSPLEMFSKSFCRELYRRESKDYSEIVYNPLTSADIRRGNFGEHIEQIEQVISDFEKSDCDLRLFNLQNETIDTLLEKLKKICANTNKPVTICIDYLQILPHEKENSKAGVDDIVRKLKVFQRENNVTLIVISSLNRASYDLPITFSSFKESGSIEFSADVVLGLQLYFDKEEMRKSDIEVDKAKKAIPRKVELKCLKNRNGRNYSCYFKYFPHVDTFLSCEESDLKENKCSRTAK